MEHLAAGSYSYRAYGCNLVSDMPFEQLLPGSDPTLETITIRRCDEFPDEPDNARRIGPFSVAAPNYLALDVDQIVQLVAQDGKTLLYRPYKDAALSSLQVFLLGSGLGSVLIQRKLLVLHGNAVEIAGHGILCVGPSGVGKSTAAAGLMQRGFRVMSDDVCAIDAQGRIIPGIPHIKLWQEAADSLQVATDGLSRILPEHEKFRLPIGDAFCVDPVPVRTIYILSPYQSDNVTCETLTGSEKFKDLGLNTYRFAFVNGMGMREMHFQQLAVLLKTLTVKRVRRPISGFKLDQLLDVLIEDATRTEAAL